MTILDEGCLCCPFFLSSALVTQSSYSSGLADFAFCVECSYFCSVLAGDFLDNCAGRTGSWRFGDSGYELVLFRRASCQCGYGGNCL